MMVSTKGRYALRVMIDLAEHQSEGYVPLKEIAARQEISEKYLESILKVLVQQRFLEGLRGKGGGYKLTRAPETYTVGSILRLTEGDLAPVACLEGPENRCRRCGALSSNRVAADDNPMKLMSIALKPLCEPPFPLERIEEMTALMGGEGRLK